MRRRNDLFSKSNLSKEKKRLPAKYIAVQTIPHTGDAKETSMLNEELRNIERPVNVLIEQVSEIQKTIPQIVQQESKKSTPTVISGEAKPGREDKADTRAGVVRVDSASLVIQDIVDSTEQQPHPATQVLVVILESDIPDHPAILVSPGLADTQDWDLADTRDTVA